MPDVTPRLGLPYLYAAQAQKEVTHNEALQRLDICVQPVAEERLSGPPESPEFGQCWLVAHESVGAWSGTPDAIAQWTEGGWRFFMPFEGLQIWVRATKTIWVFSGGGWENVLPVASLRIGDNQVVGPQQPAISGPGGGIVVDVEARAAIAAIIAAMQGHGLIAN